MNEFLKTKLNEAEVVVLGAGAGLSTAAGFEYGGALFQKHFPKMFERGYRDMYSAGFHNFSSPEEKWGYFSQMVFLQRYASGAKPLYQKIISLLQGKNYFVITTNVDHQFQKAGVEKERLFYTQGDYGLFQCARACHNKTYDNEKSILQMVAERMDEKIPSSLVPKCPVCGGEMDENLRKDEFFVEDEGWHAASERYSRFLEENKGKKILFLELGVGWNTPGIIKYPFMKMTYSFPNAFYLCVNQGENYLPEEIKGKALVLNEDLNEVFA